MDNESGGNQFDSYPVPLEQVTAYTRQHSRPAAVKGHYGTRIFIRVLLALAQCLSWRGAYRLGTAIGKLMYWLKIRRKTAMTNLDIAYGEKKTPEEKERIYKGSMINLGRFVINYLRLPFMGPSFWKNNCDWKNESILKDAMNHKKGALLIAGHIGMMDLPGGKFGMSGYPIAVVGKNIKNPAIDRFVVETRNAMNLGTIHPKGSMERILAGIRRGEAVAMAVDQNMKKKYGIFLNWMGRPASSVRSPAYVARETGAPVVAGYCFQKDADRLEVVITEEVKWESIPDDPEKELAVNAQHQSDAFQRIIYANPELWFWIHRRWKIQPDGVANPYK
jgi:KDO2-lipid IV(A) lauroyltransferase